MDFEWKPAMRDAISEVLETMFFVMVNFGGPAFPADLCAYASGISLSNAGGQMNIAFALTAPFATMITANLLGVSDGEVSVDDLQDAMKEMANMVAGNYQARTSEARWQLGLPFVIPAAPLPDGIGAQLFFSCFGEPAGVVTLTNGGKAA